MFQIEKEFKKDQDAAIEEFERKKVELKDSLLAALQVGSYQSCVVVTVASLVFLIYGVT